MKYIALVLLLSLATSARGNDEVKYRVFALTVPFASVAKAIAEVRNHPNSHYERKLPQQTGVALVLDPADLVSVFQKHREGITQDLPANAAPFRIIAKLGPDGLAVDIELEVQEAVSVTRKVYLTVFTKSSFIFSLPDPNVKDGEKLFLLCPQ